MARRIFPRPDPPRLLLSRPDPPQSERMRGCGREERLLQLLLVAADDWAELLLVVVQVKR